MDACSNLAMFRGKCVEADVQCAKITKCQLDLLVVLVAPKLELVS